MIQKIAIAAGWLTLAFIVFATLSPVGDRHARAADAFVKALGGISGISMGQLAWFLLRLKFARSDQSV